MGIIRTHAPEGAMILLQITMVSPGTHLVKNHESLFRTNECPVKKNESEIEHPWAIM